MNELINDKGVYRTAPATPGLLKKVVWDQLLSLKPTMFLESFDFDFFNP